MDEGGKRRGFAFLGLYRKHAHVPCIKPDGRAGPAEGSKVVWFHVRRVQRLPSLHATHEIPKVQVSPVSRGDALLTVCRDASYFSRFFLFSFLSFFLFFFLLLLLHPPVASSRIMPGNMAKRASDAREATEWNFVSVKLQIKKWRTFRLIYSLYGTRFSSLV